MSSNPQSPQFAIFKDCLARRVLPEPGILEPTNADGLSGQDEADAVDDFTSYLAEEIWPALPASLRSATHESHATLPSIGYEYDSDDFMLESVIPPTVSDTLLSCGLIDEADSSVTFLKRVLKDYLAEACAPPPAWSKTRTTECEICERAVPLTYHHLIPREVHDKARKKKWHPEAMLNSVAWLCRPCHSAVHHVASNEDLAREFHTVELLLARDDIQKWRKYAAKQRFGVRRG